MKVDKNKIFKLESKINSLMTENTDLKRKLKLAYKEDAAVDIFKEEIRKCVKPLKSFNKKPIIHKNPKYREHLVMLISDQHADQVVIPEAVGGLEKYDFNVALCRAETLVDRTLEWVFNMKNYEFTDLWLLYLGDHVSGEIHGAEKESFFRNMIRNSLAVGQLNALLIRDLASFFQNVHVVCVPGNHGRRTQKKDYYNPRSNWDYLVFETMRLQCSKLENINFEIPNSYSANVIINGHGVNINHGDEIKSYASLPWYGIERRTRRLLALNSSFGKNISYFFMGHFHNATTISTVNNGESIVNGAWVGTDPYAYNKMAVYNIPKQYIFGMSDKHGISFRMDIHLKDEKKERSGPERYKIDLVE